jgi:hypothetical protein
MGWDWEWMQHCVEIAEDFQSGQGTPGAYFYIFRGFESAKKVSETEQRVELMHSSRYSREFIQQSKHFRCGYVRCSYLGCKRIFSNGKH